MNIYRLIWVFFALSLVVYLYVIYTENKKLEESGLMVEVVVSKKYCDGASFRSREVFVFFKNEEYYVEFPNTKSCSELGDKVSLFYSEKYDYFYIPGTIYKYKRHVIIGLFHLLLSLLPWNKIKSLLKGKD